MYLAIRGAEQDGKTQANRAVELPELRQLLLAMILRNEALRKDSQRMRSERVRGCPRRGRASRRPVSTRCSSTTSSWVETERQVHRCARDTGPVSCTAALSSRR